MYNFCSSYLLLDYKPTIGLKQQHYYLLFSVFSGLGWAVFLGMFHVVAVKWQLESSEMTGFRILWCWGRSRAGPPTRVSTFGSSQLGGWVWEGVSQRNLLLPKKSRQQLQGCLWRRLRSPTVSFKPYSNSPRSQGSSDSREEIYKDTNTVTRCVVHWRPSLQTGCHSLFYHDYVDVPIPPLHSFVYFSWALVQPFYNLCPLLQWRLLVKLEHFFPKVFRGLKLVIQFLVTPGNWSTFWMLTCCGRSSSLSVLLGVVEEKPVLLVNIQESWCPLSIAKRSALTPVSPLGTEITGLESQARGDGMVSKVKDASPVSVLPSVFANVFIQMWKALPLHLSCTPTPRPPFQMSFQLLFLILAWRQMFHCSRITVKFLPGLPHIMGQFPRESQKLTTSEMAKGHPKRQI